MFGREDIEVKRVESMSKSRFDKLSIMWLVICILWARRTGYSESTLST